MSENGSIWVGMLEVGNGVASATEVTPVSGSLLPEHSVARVMVRLHGAPIGNVHIPARPANSIAARAAAVANSELVEALRKHREADDGARGGPEDRPAWTTRVVCPQSFPARVGAGISVIVCTRDRPAAVSQCLRSLQQTDYDPVEILVVDNAPVSDTTRRLVDHFALNDQRIRYTCEPRPGLSMARNHGLAAAKHDLVAFTDDDIVADPSWLPALVAGFAADPQAACVTGMVASRSLETRAERYFDARYSWGTAFEARRYDLTTFRDPSALYPFKAGIFGTGANFAVRREVVSKLGGFDSLLGVGAPGKGGEDLDMFVRIILAGHRLSYLPAALVWHQHRVDDHALAKQVHAYGYGLGAYLAKRLITREMPITVLAQSIGQSAVMARQMRQAAQAGRFKARGRRLASREALGVFAGALRYSKVALVRRGP